MAVSNFIPEIWSAQILETLRAVLRYGGPGVVNRDYEGEIAEAGDTVHITSFTDPSVRSYTAESDITVDSITDATRALVVDQAKYFAFDVDDVNKRQALGGWVESMTRAAAYKLASTADAYLSAAMVTAVDGDSNDLGAKTVNSADTAYALLVDLRTKLTKSNVPADGRWCIVPPELYAYLLKDSRFIDASASGTTQALRNGLVGRAAGFDIFESNTVPLETTATWSVLAGHPMATTYAEQIASTEAQRRELRFGDLIKGLHLYGAKVVREDCLAMASVTVS